MAHQRERSIWIGKNPHIIRKPLWCGQCLIFPQFLPSFHSLTKRFRWERTYKRTHKHTQKSLSSFIFNNYFGSMLFVTVYFHSISHSFRFHFIHGAAFYSRCCGQNLRRNHNKSIRHAKKEIIFNVAKSTERNIFGFDFIHLFAVGDENRRRSFFFPLAWNTMLKLLFQTNINFFCIVWF